MEFSLYFVTYIACGLVISAAVIYFLVFHSEWVVERSLRLVAAFKAWISARLWEMRTRRHIAFTGDSKRRSFSSTHRHIALDQDAYESIYSFITNAHRDIFGSDSGRDLSKDFIFVVNGARKVPLTRSHTLEAWVFWITQAGTTWVPGMENRAPVNYESMTTHIEIFRYRWYSKRYVVRVESRPNADTPEDHPKDITVRFDTLEAAYAHFEEIRQHVDFNLNQPRECWSPFYTVPMSFVFHRVIQFREVESFDDFLTMIKKVAANYEFNLGIEWKTTLSDRGRARHGFEFKYYFNTFVENYPRGHAHEKNGVSLYIRDVKPYRLAPQPPVKKEDP